MIGDGHAMGVAAEILQHIWGTTEGTFQVHHPVLSKQWPEPSGEDLGFAEPLEVFGETELTILEGLPEGCDELATEDLTQCVSTVSISKGTFCPASALYRSAI